MKDKKGFTLIELIVAMSVAAIFVICVIALISPSTKIFNRVEDSSDARLLAESLLEEIRHDANLSTELSAESVEESDSDKIKIDKTAITVNKDGYLIKTDEAGKEEALFAAQFYKNKTVEMTAKDVEGTANCVDMTLKIFSDGRELYTLDSQLKPVLGRKTSSVTGETGGSGESGGETGGTGEVTINKPKEWDKIQYLAGDIVEYKGSLYVAIKDILLDDAWFGFGADLLTANFRKITNKVWRKTDIGKSNRLWAVQPGDQFVDDNGILYIYTHYSYDQNGTAPPPDNPNWVKATPECYTSW